MAAAYTPSMSDDSVQRKTGRTWDEWFRYLDDWGARTAGHKAIARHLADDVGVQPWWSQAVTVEYERARGLRAVGQRTSGDYEVTAQRTVRASKAAAMRAWRDADARAAWLKDRILKNALAKGDASQRVSKTKMGDVLRMGLPKNEKLEVSFSVKERDVTVVRVAHTGLADLERRDALKPRWKAALDAFRDDVAAQ